MQTLPIAKTQPAARKRRPLSALNISFLISVHVLGIGGLIGYLALHGLSTAALIIGIIWTQLTIFAISAGYHRLFSHRAYDAHPIAQFFLLCFGAASFQNSALKWAADHRRHHKHVDTDRDPYNARKGFWYSHVGWVLEAEDPELATYPVPDLQRSALLVWQDRHYAIIGGVVGFVLPALLGWAAGDMWGGLILGGVTRLVAVYHATFSINSFAHWLGTQPYSRDNTSRDSLFTALLSMGEGYHNYHHTFPTDYRNGIGTFQYDPTKWVLRVWSIVGLAHNLRRAPQPLIERARWQMEEASLLARPLPATVHERALWLKKTIDEKLEQWHALVSRYETMRREQGRHARASLKALARQSRELRKEFQLWHSEWRHLLMFGHGAIAS